MKKPCAVGSCGYHVNENAGISSTTAKDSCVHEDQVSATQHTAHHRRRRDRYDQDYRSQNLPFARNVQVDDFTLVVLHLADFLKCDECERQAEKNANYLGDAMVIAICVVEKIMGLQINQISPSPPTLKFTPSRFKPSVPNGGQHP